MQNKIESENVCITDADPHTDVRTLWKRTLITANDLKNDFVIMLDKCEEGTRYIHQKQFESAIVPNALASLICTITG